jgi:hypothetical protein
MSSHPVHVSVSGTEGSLCTCALHFSKGTLFLPLYFRHMSHVFWIEHTVNFVPCPSLTIASGVPIVPIFDGTHLLSFQGKSVIKRKRSFQGKNATILILKILSTQRFSLFKRDSA